MPQWDDDIFLGQAVSGGRVLGNVASTSPIRGIGPAARIYTLDGGAPTAASTTAVCNAQAIVAAGNAIINGNTSSMDFTYGQRTANFFQNTHIGRCLNMSSSSAADTTQTVTVSGQDIYGQTLSQTKTLNGTTTVNFTKSFKRVFQVRVSAAMAGNLSVGNRDAFGYPICVREGGYVIKMGWGNVYGSDPGTVTTADVTFPATAFTNDVRGFYEPSSAADGVKRLTMVLMLTEGMVGAAATRAIAFGVPQA